MSPATQAGGCSARHKARCVQAALSPGSEVLGEREGGASAQGPRSRGLLRHHGLTGSGTWRGLSAPTAGLGLVASLGTHEPSLRKSPILTRKFVFAIVLELPRSCDHGDLNVGSTRQAVLQFPQTVRCLCSGGMRGVSEHSNGSCLGAIVLGGLQTPALPPRTMHRSEAARLAFCTSQRDSSTPR